MPEISSATLPSRRRFLMLCAGAGGLSAFGLGLAVRPFVPAANGTLMDDCRLQRELSRGPKRAALVPVSRTSKALGADVRLTVLHADPNCAEQALTAAFVELNSIEDVLSIY